MKNYQLYRTNVLLGGQMKYDIMLSDNSNTNNTGVDLKVSNFNISPISEDIPFDRYNNKSSSVLDVTWSSHGYNIKKFYEKISGYFYDGCVDPILTQDMPLYSSYHKCLYNDKYEMGCRRISHDLYGKQLSFFCPVWIEHLDVNNGDYLSFEFEFFADPKQEKRIYKKYLDIKQSSSPINKQPASIGIRPITPNILSYHDRFVKYFLEYISDIGLDKGQNYVLNLSSTGETQLNAFNVSRGISVLTDTSKIRGNLKKETLYSSLTNQQRILLEQNQLIINSLKNQLCIAKQLFNFNFCFNLTDMLPNFTIREFYSEKIYMSVHVCIKNDNTGKSTRLDIKDFYSNHEYIPRCIVSPRNIIYNIDINNEISIAEQTDDVYDKWEIEDIDINNEKFNVLSYYNDHHYIKTIDKNKILQNIIHWAPADNVDEILNFYPGFMSCNVIKKIPNTLYDTDTDIINYSYNGYNMGTPQLDIEEYNRLNNPYWCNSLNIIQYLTRDLIISGMTKFMFEDQKNSDGEFPAIPSVTNQDVNNMVDLINQRFSEYTVNVLIDLLVNADKKYSHLYSKFSSNCCVKNVYYKLNDKSGFENYDDVNVLFINISNFLHHQQSNYTITTYRKEISDKLHERIIKHYSNLSTTTKYYREGTSILAEKYNYIFEAHRYNNYVLILYTGDFLSESSNTNNIYRHHLISESFAHDVVYKKFTNLCTFNSSKLGDLKNTKDGTMRYFHNIIKSQHKNNFKCISINSKLKPVSINGPSPDIKEIELLVTGPNSIIYRNLGPISPKFISRDDYLFNFKYSKFIYNIQDDYIKNYNKYINSSFPPLYPSINYFKYLKSVQEYGLTNKMTSDKDIVGEYNSMNYNGLYSLKENWSTIIEQKMKYTYTTSEGGVVVLTDNHDIPENYELQDISYEDLDELVNQYIYNFYKKGSLNDNIGKDIEELKYITTLYKYTSKLIDTYIGQDGHQVYKYNVQIKLK